MKAKPETNVTSQKSSNIIVLVESEINHDQVGSSLANQIKQHLEWYTSMILLIPNNILSDIILHNPFCSYLEHVELEYLQSFLSKLLFAACRAAAKRLMREGMSQNLPTILAYISRQGATVFSHTPPCLRPLPLQRLNELKPIGTCFVNRCVNSKKLSRSKGVIRSQSCLLNAVFSST